MLFADKENARAHCFGVGSMKLFSAILQSKLLSLTYAGSSLQCLIGSVGNCSRTSPFEITPLRYESSARMAHVVFILR
jgi:hypothetical protein